MSSKERLKGAVAEREIVQLVRDYGWPDARRTSDGRVQEGRGDIALGPAGVHIECKRVERLNVPRAFRQIRVDCPLGDIPVLVHRPSREVWMATTELVELLALLRFREGS